MVQKMDLESLEYNTVKAVWGYVLVRHAEGYETLLYASLLLKSNLRSFISWHGDLEECGGVEVDETMSLRDMVDTINRLSEDYPCSGNSLYTQSVRQYCGDKLWRVKFHRDDVESTVRHQLQDYLYENTQNHVIVIARVRSGMEEKDLEKLPVNFVAPLKEQKESDESERPEEEYAEEETVSEAGDQPPELRVSCVPVVDPVHGKAAGDLLPGERILIRLKEDSIVYSLLQARTPGFAGTVEATVESMVPHDGRKRFVLKISDGITAQCVLRDHVRVKMGSSSGAPMALANSAFSENKLWFFLIGGVMLLLLLFLLVIRML